MTPGRPSDCTVEGCLRRVVAGEPQAGDMLFGLLYEEFKQRAHVALRLGGRNTLCTTELVNETWIRLHGATVTATSRAHYCNIAARAMRQVLVDRARARRAEKRGEGRQPLSLDAAADVVVEDPADTLALDQVMDRLAEIDPKLAELASLYLYAGLGCDEIAQMRGVSERTVYRDWRTARTFLMRFMAKSE